MPIDPNPTNQNREDDQGITPAPNPSTHVSDQGPGTPSTPLQSEGIMSPGERLLQDEIEEIMASAPNPETPPESPASRGERSGEKPDTPLILRDTTPPSYQKTTSLGQPDSPASKEKAPTTPETPRVPKEDMIDQGGQTPKRDPKGAIRTYYSDVAEAVQGEQISMTDIALAEQHRREREAPQIVATEPTQTRNWSPLLMSAAVVLLLGGAGVFGYLYLFQGERGATPQPPTITHTLIPADQEAHFDTSDISPTVFERELEEYIATLEPSPGTITALTLTTTVLDAEGETADREISAQEFITLLQTQIDTALLRSIEDRYMIGVHALAENQPFIVLETSFFENAFAGMLRWELALPNDLNFMTKPLPTPVLPPTATSTGTSTVSTTTSPGSEDTVAVAPQPDGQFIFRDIIVANRDARALMNRDGDIRLIYSFPNKNTLIITNNTETLTELFNRLNTVEFRE